MKGEKENTKRQTILWRLSITSIPRVDKTLTNISVQKPPSQIREKREENKEGGKKEGYSDLGSASPESASGSGPQSPAPFLRAHALSPAETNFISPSSDAAPPERVAFPRTRCLRLQATVCSL